MKGSHIQPQIPEVHIRVSFKDIHCMWGCYCSQKVYSSQPQGVEQSCVILTQLARETDISGKPFALRHWLVLPLAFRCTNIEVGEKKGTSESKTNITWLIICLKKCICIWQHRETFVLLLHSVAHIIAILVKCDRNREEEPFLKNEQICEKVRVEALLISLYSFTLKKNFLK